MVAAKHNHRYLTGGFAMLAEVERFINWVRRRNAQARTWRDYQYDLKQFIESLGDDRAASAVTLHDVDRFISQQAARGCQPGTINRRLAAIASLYVFLSDEDPALASPVLPHRHFLREPQRLPRPVKGDEVQKFFNAVTDTRDRAMFLLMLRCGLRIGEVAALQLSDLYLDEERPRLVARGKGSKERSVYLSPQAEHALRAYLAERGTVTCPCVFVSYLGQGLSTTAIHYRLVEYRERAGVTLSAHRLRHTFASDLVSADVPVTSIQKLLGHRWLETTQIYVSANDHQVQADYFAASQKLESWR
ncbi:MAG: tyrosine-type recombinase/integrase [Anaerolineales bacterium]